MKSFKEFLNEASNPHTKKAHDLIGSIASKHGMSVDTHNTSSDGNYKAWKISDPNKKNLKSLHNHLIELGYVPEEGWSNTHTKSPNRNYDKINKNGRGHTVQIINHKIHKQTSLHSLQHHQDIFDNLYKDLKNKNSLKEFLDEDTNKIIKDYEKLKGMSNIDLHSTARNYYGHDYKMKSRNHAILHMLLTKYKGDEINQALLKHALNKINK